ncbi:hypothetical protein KWI08_19690, partial [Morganella morganii]|uniref:hypothetical protein n=1 Tax=Morganella morganii TaxID=582 RepID=UPI0021D1424F
HKTGSTDNGDLSHIMQVSHTRIGTVRGGLQGQDYAAFDDDMAPYLIHILKKKKTSADETLTYSCNTYTVCRTRGSVSGSVGSNHALIGTTL